MGKTVERYDMILIVPYYEAKHGFIWKTIEYRFQSPGVLSIATYSLLKFRLLIMGAISIIPIINAAIFKPRNQ
ncbi:MAG: hypothetical protein ACP5DZ_02960 [Bacteroidales bacterium]